MALHFSKASTQFVRNLVELGVCENTDCLNAYHILAGSHSRSTSQSLSAPTPSQVLLPPPAVNMHRFSSPVPSSRPVVAVDMPAWIHALDSEVFPLSEVCHQLSSSELQVSQPLERFVDTLFRKTSQRYAVQLETLVRALRLLELVQLTNIRTHHRQLQSQPSLRSTSSNSHVSNTTASCSNSNHQIGANIGTDNPFSTASGARIPTNGSTTPTLPPRKGGVAIAGGAAMPHASEGQLLHMSTTATTTKTATSALAHTRSAPMRITELSHTCRPAYACVNGSCSVGTSPSSFVSHKRGSLSATAGTHRHPHTNAHASGGESGSVSSGTVGPFTDTDRHSNERSSGPHHANGASTTPVKPSPLTSWCLPTVSPCELPMACCAGGCAHPSASADLPSLLRRLHLCTVCEGSRVFALQYYNVHLLLAACLALSVSINEVNLVEMLSEDVLMHQVAEMSQCTDLSLQVAVRVVCETLEGQLCVFDSDVDLLVHRLNVVEACVFTTEDL